MSDKDWVTNCVKGMWSHGGGAEWARVPENERICRYSSMTVRISAIRNDGKPPAESMGAGPRIEHSYRGSVACVCLIHGHSVQRLGSRIQRSCLCSCQCSDS